MSLPPPGMLRLKIAGWVTLLLLTLQNVGCSGIGPHTVARDRLDYISAIGIGLSAQVMNLKACLPP
jgi:hypothetical protein